ncbi:PREDICTED: transcription factor IIIB 50 kDa subunit, partial [Acanthisitta chloris]|uniref:transcription factor IIIB 50 kDa subunit n=1 Tax=Acanthisitta chloris TaxID=57068 RepID=UPI0004F0C6BF
VAYSQSTGQKEQLSRCLQRGIRRVQDLCKVLQLPAVFEETAVSYFQRAVQLPAFHLVSLEKKELLGGCCVFVTCRQHNWPLTMGTICSLLYAKQELFASVYVRLQKELELSVPALSLADLVKTHLNSFRLFKPTGNVPVPFQEDKEKLVARTMSIVELASETWLVTGRHPVPVVTAAAFLAWQSLQPSSRLSCPLARFCQLAGVDVPPPAHLRLKELLEILLGMASKLEDGEEQRDTAPAQGSPAQGSPGEDSLGEGTPCEDSPDQGTPGSPPAAGGGAQEKGCPSAGKWPREGTPRPLLPPCLIHPRKRLRTAAPSTVDSALTGDEPISDSEIEQYLRGPEEVQAFRKARAWL